MNARDPYLHENLTPDQITLIEEGMRNTVIDGIPLNPRDTVSNPEKFNSYPFEMRKRAFEMLPKLVSGRDQYVDMATGQDVGSIRQVGMGGNDQIIDLIMNAGRPKASPAPTQSAPAIPQPSAEEPASTMVQGQVTPQLPREQQILQAAVPSVNLSKANVELDPISSLIMNAGRPTIKTEAPQKAQPKSFTDYLKGTGEAALSMVSSGVVAPIAAAEQLVRGGAKPGAPDYFSKRMEAATYQPKTEAGQEILQGAAKVFEESKLPPVLTPEFSALSRTRVRPLPGVKVPPQAGVEAGLPPGVPASAVQGAAQAAGRAEPTFGKPKVSYAEFQQQLEEQKAKPQIRMGAQPAGAAAVDLETQRIQKAKELPIPITLEKSQATRDPADVRFARETAKNPTFGGPFQEKYAEQNRLLQQNLDYFIEQTGSERVGVPPTEFAKTLDDLVNRTKKERKNEIDRAYTEARNAGETAEVINVQNLSNWVKENASASENAPVIKTVEKEIKRLSKNNEISLNDIEEIRKTINNVRDVSPTNARYGGKAIKVIDQMTADKGGELYKKARGLNTAFATEFQDTPVVAKITAMKRGTTQRQVALENLAESTMMKGTGEDVRQLFASLERMGPEGQAMINDLRGYVAQYIKDQATKGTQLDIYGKRYISTPELDKVITNLDKSGKLEFLFGKKGAEQYRTINDVVKDIQTVPKETTNPSGTAAQLGQLAAEMGTQYALTGVPVPLIMVGKELAKKRKEKKEMKKIRDFIEYGNK